MRILEELRATFFQGPVMQIFFGEPTARRIMEKVLRESRIDPIEEPDIDLETLRAMAAGTYPIMVQSFDDFRFDTIVPEDRLREYLREHMDRPDPRIWTSFAEREAHVGVVQRFLRHIGERPFKILEIDSNVKCYFFANSGERLVIATLGRAPVPGETVCA